MFASEYPAEVEGLVLVDPTPARLMMIFTEPGRQALQPDPSQFDLLRQLEWFGLLRLLQLPEAARKLPA